MKPTLNLVYRASFCDEEGEWVGLLDGEYVISFEWRSNDKPICRYMHITHGYTNKRYDFSFPEVETILKPGAKDKTKLELELEPLKYVLHARLMTVIDRLEQRKHHSNDRGTYYQNRADHMQWESSMYEMEVQPPHYLLRVIEKCLANYDAEVRNETVGNIIKQTEEKKES